MPRSDKIDCVVIGGGVIGLSIAYQLARDGLSVTLLERGEPGREASWAGAGILPPASWYEEHHALDALAEHSRRLFPDWSADLLERSAVDNEYWPCGSLYYETPANAEYLGRAFGRWRRLDLKVDQDRSSGVWRVPEEAQVRNPRHLKALWKACESLGVRVVTQAPVERFKTSGGRIDGVETPSRIYSADSYCLAAGCWTPDLARRAASRAPGSPVLGQMLLLHPATPVMQQIVHCYPHYLVPRRDGRVLVGATVEDTGFEKRTTEEARRELIGVAHRLAPELESAEVEGFWCGLRPRGGGDELPQIGRLPGLINGLVASGHYRSGLQFSTATAEIISSIVRNDDVPAYAEGFSPARFSDGAAVALHAASGAG